MPVPVGAQPQRLVGAQPSPDSGVGRRADQRQHHQHPEGAVREREEELDPGLLQLHNERQVGSCVLEITFSSTLFLMCAR